MEIAHFNARRYPSPFEYMLPGTKVVGAVVCAVLMQRVDGYKAYAAIMPDQGTGTYDLEFVSKHGNGLSYEEAQSHFPYLRKESYVD